jgi:hypothetical protein
MGSRYYITGVQLGMIEGIMRAYEKQNEVSSLEKDLIRQIREILQDQVQEHQFVGVDPTGDSTMVVLADKFFSKDSFKE